MQLSSTLEALRDRYNITIRAQINILTDLLVKGHLDAAAQVADTVSVTLDGFDIYMGATLAKAVTYEQERAAAESAAENGGTGEAGSSKKTPAKPSAADHRVVENGNL